MGDTNYETDILGLAKSYGKNKKKKPSQQLIINIINGRRAEKKVLKKLEKNTNVEILGKHVTVHTDKGVRYVDILIRNKKTNKIVAIEVKSGNAKRNKKQITKDKIIDSGEGTFGQNGFYDPNHPLIGTETTNTVTNVKQVPL